MAELGGIDILVNSAGIAVMAPLDDYRLEDLDRTLAVNVRAAFVATQAAAKHMKTGAGSSRLAVATPTACHSRAARRTP